MGAVGACGYDQKIQLGSAHQLPIFAGALMKAERTFLPDTRVGTGKPEVMEADRHN
jgi:hypothetical protein